MVLSNEVYHFSFFKDFHKELKGFIQSCKNRGNNNLSDFIKSEIILVVRTTIHILEEWDSISDRRKNYLKVNEIADQALEYVRQIIKKLDEHFDLEKIRRVDERLGLNQE